MISLSFPLIANNRHTGTSQTKTSTQNPQISSEVYSICTPFLDRVRYFTSTAFWTTTEGMTDLEYIGNVALAQWDAPPPEVLRHLGLE